MNRTHKRIVALLTASALVIVGLTAVTFEHDLIGVPLLIVGGWWLGHIIGSALLLLRDHQG